MNGLLGISASSIAAVASWSRWPRSSRCCCRSSLLGYVPLWIVASRNSRDLYRFVHGMTPNERQRNYLRRVLIGRDPAKEVRAFQLGRFLRGRYDRLYDERIVELRSLARRRHARSLLGALRLGGRHRGDGRRRSPGCT